MGGSLEKLKYLTPATLFDIEGLMAGEMESSFFCLILYAAGILMMVIGVRCFEKKDLPV